MIEKTGRTRSSPTAPINMIGMRFGRLFVVAESGRRKVGGQMKRIVECRCDCGATVVAISAQLRNGNTKSCGCLNRDAVTKHGDYKSPVYKVWHAMIERCRNPRNEAWKDYGGRGISVCERWREYANFRADMGARPIGGTLERVDVNAGYSPENCRWATQRDQANNRRNNRLVTIDGVTKTAAEWARAAGLSKSCVLYRLGAGWPAWEAVSLPSDRRRQHK